MSRLGAAIGWRLRRTFPPGHPARVLAGAAKGLPKRFAEARSRAAFERLLAGLETESASTRPGGPSLRLLAIGSWTFPLHSQSFVYQELAALVAAGIDVRIAASADGPEEGLPPYVERLRGRVLRLAADRKSGERALAAFRACRGAAVESLFADLSRAAGASVDDLARHPHVLRGFAFVRLAESFRADYVHSYFFYEGALAAYIAQRLLGIPRGLTAYTDHQLDDYPLKLVREQLRGADLIVATSERIRKELESFGGLDASRLMVKPNSVDTSFFSASPAPEPVGDEPFRLLSVSRFDPKKGITDLIAALDLLRQRGLPVTLDLVGGVSPGDEAGERERLAVADAIERSGLDRQVRSHGFLSATEVRTALARAHLFVAPYVETESGDKDGIPTAALEAMACGVPVIACRSGSIEELIEDGSSGALVPPGSPVRLAEEIARWLANPVGRRALGEGGRVRVRDAFSVERREPALAERIRSVVRARQQDRTGEATT